MTPVRFRYIVIPVKGDRWGILDAQENRILAKTYGDRQAINAQAAAYRLNRERCQNCLEAIITYEGGHEQSQGPGSAD
jgi:hypothetical protein